MAGGRCGSPQTQLRWYLPGSPSRGPFVANHSITHRAHTASMGSQRGRTPCLPSRARVRSLPASRSTLCQYLPPPRVCPYPSPCSRQRREDTEREATAPLGVILSPPSKSSSLSPPPWDLPSTQRPSTQTVTQEEEVGNKRLNHPPPVSGASYRKSGRENCATWTETWCSGGAVQGEHGRLSQPCGGTGVPRELHVGL